LFDGSRIFDEEDEKIISLVDGLKEKECIVAINKTDLEHRFDRSRVDKYSPIEVSAKKGFAHLTQKLENLFDSIGQGDELMLVTARQIDAVTKTKISIQEAKVPLLNGELEFFSYHLQEAVKMISSISKPYESEEILDKMFGEFCLGK